MFCPSFRFRRVTEISLDFLQRHGIRGLILDVDNTLAHDQAPEPAQGVLQWLLELKSAKIPVILISNNSNKRVAPFAKALGLPFHASALKPFKKGIGVGLRTLLLPKESVAIVGDQLFTDVLGGRFSGIRSILVDPLDEYEILLIKIKRGFEKALIGFYEKRGRIQYERDIRSGGQRR